MQILWVYSNSDYCTKNEEIKFVDVPAAMRGIPFSSYGYPAEKYDAPVNSYGLGNDLIWTAKSFLVDMPSFVNNDSISFLAGFSWGYIERSSDNGRNIEIVPIEAIEQNEWLEEVSFLKENCSNWNFV